jgi:hypothetical protein
MTPETPNPAQFHLAIADASETAAGLKLLPSALDAPQQPLAQKNASSNSYPVAAYVIL